MAHKIIQWNCRGLRSNYNDLAILLQEHSPSAVCLQETNLKPNTNISFKNYTMVNCFGPANNERACWGVSILVKDGTPHQHITLKTNLQAVAVNINCHRPMTICSVYLPPNRSVDVVELRQLVKQLPKPFMLLGDFNGHHTMWGCRDINPRGRIIEDFLSEENLCIFNDDTTTYLHPASGSATAIDLSLCDPDLYLDYTWRVNEDLCSSDHYPIFIESNNSIVEERVQHWRLHRADWEAFQQSCGESLTISQFENEEGVDDPIALFTAKLHNIADKSIPKTSTVPKKLDKPWFDEGCRKAIDKRKKSLQKFKKHPTRQNLDGYKKDYAKARRTISEAKRQSWRAYVSTLNNNTSAKHTWQMLRRISGKRKDKTIKYLVTDSDTITNKTDIAETLATSFAAKSSPDHYQEKFRKIRDKEKENTLDFESDNDEKYNVDFSKRELIKSIAQATDSATGPDEIHYQFLKHLPDVSLDLLLLLLNDLWQSQDFPDGWREATVIPIPKPGKDRTDPNNYRPIALTSCLCKIMERMINHRLTWFLQDNHIITKYQCGFQKGKSTTDHLVRLETYIRQGFVKNQHTVGVFFDLEKAYDTTWKGGIMKDLHEMGLKGRLPLFIDNFLKGRKFKVRLDNTHSSLNPQEEGVPQGSILSPTLFTVKINSIIDALPDDIEKSLYVDDLAVYCQSSNMAIIERRLQGCLDKLVTCADENGFKFSPTKTLCVHFCKKNGLQPEPNLKLYGQQLPVEEQVKFLGLFFDKKLSFIPHIKYMKDKCRKALQLLRVISSKDWGGDRTTLLRIYRSHIRSKLDYGCIVYGSARRSYLAVLDPIANQGLRLCSGAFRTSPIESLQVETGEPSLETRRLKLSLQYYMKMKANPENPAYSCVVNPEYKRLFNNKPGSIPTLGIRLQPHLEDMEVELDAISVVRPPECPPWLLQQPNILFNLSDLRKGDTCPLVFQSMLLELFCRFPRHRKVYTDGSKEDKRTAMSFVCDDHEFSCRINDEASICTAELLAIEAAIEYIWDSNDEEFMIITDSLSSLQALKSQKLNNPVVSNILHMCHYLSGHKDIIFCWVPSHIGIQGNERADVLAKAALDKTKQFYYIPYTDFKYNISVYLDDILQGEWNINVTSKLFEVQPIIKRSFTPMERRRDDIVLCRARIGHAYFTNGYLLRGELRPMCCNTRLTVRHVLLSCAKYAHIRRKYFAFNSLFELFRDTPAGFIIQFLRECNLYSMF